MRELICDTGKIVFHIFLCVGDLQHFHWLWGKGGQHMPLQNVRLQFTLIRLINSKVIQKTTKIHP